jgi:hypothetical protein
MVKELLSRVPPPAYAPPPAQAPAPAPASGSAPALAPAMAPLPAPPFYPPPGFPAPGPPAAQYRAPQQTPFLGQPIAPLIVGADIGIDILNGRACVCAIAAAFPGRTHRPFECPIRLHATFGRCPGWTAAGARIPASWNGENLTPACRAEWRAFALTLPLSNIPRGATVNF